MIEACRHGKDVYCQKPETRTLREGPLMVAAARRYGRVVSGGSQRVLEDYRKHGQPVLGRTSSARSSRSTSTSARSRSPATCRREPVPEKIDWDMWLGPALGALQPYRCSGSYSINGTSWRSFCDYSGGGMTDWGGTTSAAPTFAIDVRELQPEEVTYHNDKEGRT